MAPRPTPTAEGTLARTPFAHVLMYLRERKLSGTLAIQCPLSAGDLGGECLLAFEQGQLAQIKLPRVLDPLGAVLREMGAITDDQLHESLARLAAREGLQGDILVAMGACDAATIERGLRAQLRRKALRFFAVTDAPYQYFADFDLLAGFGGAKRPREDVLALLWRGVRAHPDTRTIDAVLAKVGAHALRLRDDADLRLFEFGPAEAPLLDVLRAGPAAVEQVLLAGNDPQLARAFAYVLLIAKQVDLAPASAAVPRAVHSTPPLTTSARPSPPPPRDSVRPPLLRSSQPPPRPSQPPLPAELKPRLAEAEKHLAAMQDQTYFEMLGVATNASDDEVRAAFMDLAARWHPDRVPANAPALREIHQRIFALLNEAQNTLCDAQARGRYLVTVQDGGGTPNSHRKIAALIEAATDVQKAEICLRRREYAEAERLARRALAVNAEDPTTMVVLAHVLIEKQPEAPVDDAVGLLTRAVELAPKHDRGHVLLGQIYKRRGDAGRALLHFKQAAEANPKNVDALREVRLAEMRARSGGSGVTPAETPAEQGAAGGFLSKLFKK
jgi:tetratricopeptide (TPR) repeat protein